ncbi:MAG: OstA-like protein [Bacteroidales bacterium]|nr:OstA-like protein [Bacteroidales bacterium]
MKRLLTIVSFWLVLCGVVAAQNSTTVLTINPQQKTQPRSELPKQTKPKPTPKPATRRTSDGNVTYIYLEHAMQMLYNEDEMADAQLLVDNVCFRHDEAYLYCDSAYFYQTENSFLAYGHVRIIQGDTLSIYGNQLTYFGDEKMARLRGNVRMVNRDVELITDSLNYDRKNDVGYYFNGGELHNNEDTLTSVFGYYYTNSKTAVFTKNVVGHNKDMVMNSDTLHYNTETNLATILGPTHIIYEDSTHIETSRGWYNTKTEQSMLLDSSYVMHESGKYLFADTIFYDNKQGKGEGFSHVELRDTTNDMSLFGNYGYYIEKDEIGLVTDSAMLVEYSSSDTLYLHADTLYTHLMKDTIMVDTLVRDTSFKVVLAFPNVRLYRNDLQGVADSAFFTTRDSVLTLMKQPIIWSEGRQITGDTIRLYEIDSTDYARVIGKAFMCEKVDSTMFNQLSGKEIVGYINDEELRKVDVNGNAQCIFFPEEDGGGIIGMNTIESSYLYAYIKDEKLDRLVFMPSPSGSCLPLDMVASDRMYLANYSWQIEKKPINKNDIFRQNQPVIAVADNIESTAEQRTNNTDKSKPKTTRKAQKEEEAAAELEAEKNKGKTNSNEENRPSGFGFGSSSSFGSSNGVGSSGSGSTLSGLGGVTNSTGSLQPVQR